MCRGLNTPHGGGFTTSTTKIPELGDFTPEFGAQILSSFSIMKLYLSLPSLGIHLVAVDNKIFIHSVF